MLAVAGLMESRRAPGYVYRSKLLKGVGHVQHGDRHGVVVQAQPVRPRFVLFVAPTSTSARAASFRPEIDLQGQRTGVLVEQLERSTLQRLDDRWGT